MKNKTVILMRGQSGSGKSTWAKKNAPGAVVCSADHFFHKDDGTYRFNVADLGKAHGACQDKFLKALQDGATEVLVDNTNTSVHEMRSYYEAAKKFGYDVKVVEFLVSPEITHARNIHGVPFEGVKRQYDRLVQNRVPSGWDVEMVSIKQ